MSIPESTPIQIQKSEKFLNSLTKPACNCNNGVRMCYKTPCMGTVDDLEKLIDAGYAKNLMLDFWMGRDPNGMSERVQKTMDPGLVDSYVNNPFEENVPYLVPALKGHEGKITSMGKTGTCNLLVDNKCSVHDKGLKPIQGQTACCKIQRVYNDPVTGKQLEIDERFPILHTWNTQRGKDLIARWKKEVNYTGPDNLEIPTDKISQLGILLELMIGPAREREALKAGGVPDFTEEEKNPNPVYLTYEKPY